MQKIKQRQKTSYTQNLVLRFIKNNAGILIGLLCLCVFMTFATDSFLSSKNLLTVLRQICINSLLAFGMTFVLIIGGIDLTVGSVLGASGVAVVMLIEKGIPLLAAVLLALFLGALVGLVNGLIVAYVKMPPFIVTLSMQGVVRGIAYIITDGRSVSCKDKVFTSIGNGYLFGIPIPIYIVAVVMLVIGVVLYKTRFGRRMYALGDNETAAVFTGMYRSELRLYQLMEELGNAGFVQVSKACIINLQVLTGIRPLLNSRMEATLTNGEKINITRKYVASIREKLQER